MKKLFISVPMKGRTEEQIKASMDKMHKIAEAVFGEQLEVIDSFIEGSEYNGKPIACLGESIKRMQEADYFIGPSDAWDHRGCWFESEVVRRYFERENGFYVEEEFFLTEEEIQKKREEPTDCMPRRVK